MHFCYIVLYCFIVFFFFKQKTAYEMRISDWSSDVCSSDLLPDAARTFDEPFSKGRNPFVLKRRSGPLHRLLTGRPTEELLQLLSHGDRLSVGNLIQRGGCGPGLGA